MFEEIKYNYKRALFKKRKIGFLFS